jgi:cysteine desulfurase
MPAATEKAGVTVSYLPVDGRSRRSSHAQGGLSPRYRLVSIAAANPEIGTVQPLKEIGRVTRAAGVALHVDGVGALGRVPLNVEVLGIDLLTISGNDLYAPPGSGALWVRPGVRIHPQVLGGGQEGGYRSGTENVPGVVGLGVAPS